jgi:hypothetical protein
MSLCVLAAGKLTVLAVSAFTLSWTHSVEKTRWEESWQVTPQGLVATSARVEGSGAGMEPPRGAVFDGSGWRYEPDLPSQQRLVLADSGTAGAWRLCAGDLCMSLGGGQGTITLESCR